MSAKTNKNPVLKEEYLDLVDENDNVIGKKPRRVIYAEGLVNFRVVNAFIVNNTGKIWIPKRGAHKRIFPLCLDMSMGGHVESGETYDQAFKREVLEELNLDLKHYKYKLLGHLTPKDDAVAAFMNVYEIRSDKDPSYNTDDFVEHFWLTPMQIIEKIASGEKAKDDLPKLIKKFYITPTII